MGFAAEARQVKLDRERASIAQCKENFAKHDQTFQRLFAKRLVAASLKCRARKIFVGITAPEPPPFEYVKKHKNMYNMTFLKDQVAEAEAWVLNAMREGYTPAFYFSSGCYSGSLGADLSSAGYEWERVDVQV